MTRRTQEERRSETIGKLLEATIDALCEVGYAAASTKGICKRAGVSQGALFNHFDKRVDLIVATTEAICARQLERYDQATAELTELDEGQLRTVVELIRASTRTREHHAWHEVMVAARTDAELRVRVAPSLQAFETALLESGRRVLGRPDDDDVGIVALSIMHMFDSEAVTTTVYPNAAIEEARVNWAVQLLKAELDRAKER